jgi:hypothetical protein
MSGRIASLVGITDSGDVVQIAAGTSKSLDTLLKTRLDIREALGVWKKGPREIKLKELYCLATATGGGELKARLKF